MNDVAEAAGVTKPVLYQHFRSKRELYKQVLTDVGDHLLDAITKATAAAKSPHEQVELGFIAYFRFVEANEAAFRVLFGGGTRRDEEFAAQVAIVEGAIAEAIAALIDVEELTVDAAPPARPRPRRPGRGRQPPLDGRGRRGAGRGRRPPHGRPRLARPPRDPRHLRHREARRRRAAAHARCRWWPPFRTSFGTRDRARRPARAGARPPTTPRAGASASAMAEPLYSSEYVDGAQHVIREHLLPRAVRARRRRRRRRRAGARPRARATRWPRPPSRWRCSTPSCGPPAVSLGRRTSARCATRSTPACPSASWRRSRRAARRRSPATSTRATAASS